MNLFDDRANEWDSDPGKVERARVVANAIREKISPDIKMTALEYGCGTGLLSFALQNNFSLITLADNSQGMLDVLREKIRNTQVENMHPLLVQEDFGSVPDIQVDVIYSLLVLHHIPDTVGLIKLFYSLLKPGGFLCISDLEKEDGSFHGPTVTNIHRGFDHAQLQSQLEEAGFINIQFSHVFDVHKQVNGQDKSFPIFLLTAIRE